MPFEATCLTCGRTHELYGLLGWFLRLLGYKCAWCLDKEIKRLEGERGE